ncbi:MAG: porin [Gammaproteobacteria bacterium]|nr:porin [Gammaproteobacteria bacterium]
MANWKTIHLVGFSTIVCASLAFADIRFGEDGLSGNFDNLQLRGNFSASLQAAQVDPIETNRDGSDVQVDGSVRLSLEYATDSALLFGIVADIDSGNNEIRGFERDEFYAYAASGWGRVEVGENDGPGDTLSYHAPGTGLGQVRGDFARYTGTVALLSPFDTRDAAKVTYLSPPLHGFRGGVSYSPEFEINEDDPDRRRRLKQQDVVEVAGQYNTVMRGTTYGVSAAYVTGSADNVADHQDIKSWSIGAEINRGALTVGAAYVDRGRSNLLPTAAARSEWNAGVKWHGGIWSVAASTAITDAGRTEIRRYGVGGTYDIWGNIYLAIDAVIYEEVTTNAATLDGFVSIVEIGVRF